MSAIPQRSTVALSLALTLGFVTTEVEAQDLRWSGDIASSLGVALASCDDGDGCDLTNYGARNVLTLQMDTDLSTSVAARANLGIHNLSEPRSKTVDDTSDSDLVQPIAIRPGEVWVAGYDILPGWDLRVGSQLIKWGQGDGYSPSDRLNPYDLSDPTQFDRRLAVPAVHTAYHLGDVTLSATWLPFFKESLLSDRLIKVVDDAATDGNVTFDDDAIGGEAPTVRNVRTKLTQPEQTLSEGAVALRAEWAASFADLAVGWYYGRDTLPVLSGEIVPENFFDGSDVDLLLNLRYPRMQMISAEVRAPIAGGVAAWADSVVIIPSKTTVFITQSRLESLERLNVIDSAPDRDITTSVQTGDPYFLSTAGADVTLGELVYVNLQYIRGFIFERNPGDLHNFLMLALRFPAQDTPVFAELRGGVESDQPFEAFGWLGQTRLTTRFADHFRLSAVVMVQGGQTGTTLQAFSGLSEARLEASASF